MNNSENKVKCIPAHIVTQRKICFREAASIIKMAHANHCEATIISGDKSAETTSILSLIGLKITVGTSVVVITEGYTEREVNNAVKDIIKLLATPEE